MRIQVENLVEKDIPDLVSFTKGAFLDTFVQYCDAGDMRIYCAAAFTIPQFRAEFFDTKCQFFVIKLNSKIIAYAKMRFDFEKVSELEGFRYIEIQRFYVEKEFHGKGIAQILMKKCLEHAQKLKFEVIWLGVTDYNIRARKFYKKYDFEEISKHIFPFGNSNPVDLIVAKFLKQA